MSLKEIGEKQLLDLLKRIFEEKKPPTLKNVFAKVNLATKQFKDIWSSWWEGELPPRQEIDLIFTFLDSGEVSLIGVEVEYFKNDRKNPYKGLEQALAFSLFGFDSLVLWHIFAPELENKIIENYVKTVRELLEGFNLPLVYFATKFSENKFEFFSPFSSSLQYEAMDVLSSLLDYCKEKRNPILYKEEVRQRRNKILFINASNEYIQHPSVRRLNSLSEENINKIVEAYRKFTDTAGFCRVVDKREVKKNDYNLNVTLYVMPIEEPEHIDVIKEFFELKELEKERQITVEKLEYYISELNKVIGD